MSTRKVTLRGPQSWALTAFGKRAVALQMCAKGRAFLHAAVLLRRAGGHELVVLHLLCQGIENLLKGALLFADYDQYRPELKKLGHHLDRLAREAVKACGLKQPPERLVSELSTLSSLYAGHFLRYGRAYDLISASTPIPSELVWRKTAAMLRLIHERVRESQACSQNSDRGAGTAGGGPT